ncbi:MAG TPA: hypothetical protein VIM04_12985 [Candidatus Binatia bacterium]
MTRTEEGAALQRFPFVGSGGGSHLFKTVNQSSAPSLKATIFWEFYTDLMNS